MTSPEPPSTKVVRVNTLGHELDLPVREAPDGHESGNHKDAAPSKSLRDILKGAYKDTGFRPGENFLPPDELTKILTWEAVKHALEQALEEHLLQSYADRICGVTNSDISYRRILAILIVMPADVSAIHDFINEGVCDQDLPLTWGEISGKSFLSRKKQPKVLLKCFGRWSQMEPYMESFNKRQWEVVVPFLEYEFLQSGTTLYVEVEEESILPWVKRTECKSAPRLSDASFGAVHEDVGTAIGGYGEVFCVRIPESCQDFHEHARLRSRDGPFALKKMTHKRHVMHNFKQEVEALRKINGHIQHDHRVSLLTALKHGDEFYLLFPWADCDLEDYWANRRPEAPTMRLNVVHWFMKQCIKITEVIKALHDLSGSEHLPDPKIYGRHGDIKPESMLVFMRENGLPDFVLADFGHCKFHSIDSRSRQPNTILTSTPQFRPPEVDIKDEKITRSYDIWTLGCLFLDFINWFLGGQRLRKEFAEERFSASVNGSSTDTYFDATWNEKDETYEFTVKHKVRHWLSKLHDDARCTNLIHDLLGVIETEMLVVETPQKKRTRPPQFLAKLEGFEQLFKGPGAVGYSITPNPVHRTTQASTMRKGQLSPKFQPQNGLEPDQLATRLGRTTIALHEED